MDKNPTYSFHIYNVILKTRQMKLYIKMTPISQKTILLRKATYAMAKERRNPAARNGKKN